ncbi:unnamed protein product [Schistosoma rodhaini]|uniref:tRNA-intron lyase n=1 Tax=Schistosoma rodhaini TaxID=6188 RepID=A0AA85GL82_9TREM|nr:unnamed protein product [Schistosoma rodhaini]
MEVFLGRPKLKKPMQIRQSSLSTTSSCFLSESGSNSSSTLPFPILLKEDFTGFNSDHDDNNNDGINSCEQFTFQAVLLNGAKTLITDLEQIKILRKRGCYGFSQNDDFNLRNKTNSIPKEYSTDDDDSDDNDSGDTSDAEISIHDFCISKGIEKSDENSFNETDVTHLILNDVETLFLLHGLGCLDVYLPVNGSSQFHSTIECQQLDPLSLTEVWFCLCTGCVNLPCLQIHSAREQIEKYSEKELHLLRRYAVYIYYRSRGWIVRSGLCVGGADYLLYAEDPNRRHASFCVLVDRDSTAKDGEQLNCSSIAAHVRVAHSVGKRLILCRVSLPSIEEFSNNPWEGVRKTTVKETLIDYWKPKAN